MFYPSRVHRRKRESSVDLTAGTLADSTHKHRVQIHSVHFQCFGDSQVIVFCLGRHLTPAQRGQQVPEHSETRNTVKIHMMCLKKKNVKPFWKKGYNLEYQVKKC